LKILSPHSALKVLTPWDCTVCILKASLNKPQINKRILLDVISDTAFRHIPERDVLVRPYTSQGLLGLCTRSGEVSRRKQNGKVSVSDGQIQ
jgi:hypothetical protein